MRVVALILFLFVCMCSAQAQDVTLITEASECPVIPYGRQAVVVIVDSSATATTESPAGANTGGGHSDPVLDARDAAKAQRKAILVRAAKALQTAYQAEDLTDPEIDALQAKKRSEFESKLKAEVEALKRGRLKQKRKAE